ncbi:MAG: hypothetical protein M3130_06940 [Actinomycetota bacterium]|nr:hypothetical protein [Actinomycetota bacterium]MDQ6935003.1 hypothetical protein [Actinomycetota bacterium]
MDAFLVMVMAAVMLGIGVLALLAVRRLSVMSPGTPTGPGAPDRTAASED